MSELTIASVACFVGGFFGVLLGMGWGVVIGKKMGRAEEREGK